MGDRARILILNERDPRHPLSGGAEVHVTRVFGRLAERGHEVTLAAAGFEGGLPEERVDGIDVRRLGRLRDYYRRVHLLCRRETRAGRFDVVVECLNKVPFYAPLYSAAPVLALCHHLFGEVAFRERAWPVAAAVWAAERPIPLLYRRVPFITISESSRLDLIQRGIPPESIRVSHCGIDPPAATGEPIATRPARVVYVGRLARYKNVHLLLEAMARLRSRLPEAETWIVGDGPERARLEALAKALGLLDRTRFLGFTSDSERDAALASSRVSVFPSDKEGWGLTVIEANALGTPVVASDVAGLRDSVLDGETGFLVPPGDVDAFAVSIARLLEEDPLATRMSDAARAWARNFDWDTAADEMGAAIDELTA